MPVPIQPHATVIALDVGGSSVKSGVVRCTTPPAVVDRRQTALDHRAPADQLIALLAGIIAAHLPTTEPPCGVAFGVPSPFDYTNGVSLMQHKFAALYAVDLGAALRATLQQPALAIRYRNDAEAAIVGEVLFGRQQIGRRVLGITLGTGIGSSFLDAGRPIASDASVPPNGALWSLPHPAGGRADDHFSTRGLLQRLQRVVPSVANVAAAAAIARAGDGALQTAFADFGRELGAFVAPHMARFGAQALLVLGGIARALDLFGPTLRAELSVPVYGGTLGADAPLLGAAALFDDSGIGEQ